MATYIYDSGWKYIKNGRGSTAFEAAVNLRYPSNDTTQPSQSIENNTSTVIVRAIFKPYSSYASTPYSGYNAYPPYYILKVRNKKTNTELFSRTIYQPTLSTDNYVDIGQTITVPHDSLGKGALEITFSWDPRESDNYTDWLPQAGSISSGTIELPDIPRATVPKTDKTEYTFGENVIVTFSPASDTFTHKLSYNFVGITQEINFESGDTIKIPEEWGKQIPALNQGTLKLTLKTFNETTSIGEKEISITVKVPDSWIPILGDAIIEEDNIEVATYWKKSIIDYSKLKATFNAIGQYGATIKSYSTQITGTTDVDSKIGNIIKTGTVKNNEVSFSVTVTDSRG